MTHNPDSVSEDDRCPWLVRVPSNNPEPDSEADCWMEVECGAPLRSVDDVRRQVCERGHTFPSYQDWCESPDYAEERMTM